MENEVKDINTQESAKKIVEVFKPILTTLMDQPDLADIQVVLRGRLLRFEIQAPAEECGKLIGRKGETISALKTVLRKVAGRYGIGTYLSVVSDEDVLYDETAQAPQE